MKKEISFSVDSELYEKFNIVCTLTKKPVDEAVEESLRWYVHRALENATKDQSTSKPNRESEEESFSCKANRRIHLWASRPNQINHKIIKAYFIALDINGEATLDLMEHLCSNPDCKDLFVSTFKENYSNMKTDRHNSHGKVFEDDGNRVWIWDKVKDTLMKYKSSFYSEVK